ncbi:MAG: DUF294 nucleotidyltransferase-like domain-containing protein, partial [Bacteroidota bacterium]
IMHNKQLDKTSKGALALTLLLEKLAALHQGEGGYIPPAYYIKALVLDYKIEIPQGAIKHLEELRKKAEASTTAYKQLTALLKSAYGQALRRVLKSKIFDPSNSNGPGVVEILAKLSLLHQEQGESATDPALYIQEAVHDWQVIINDHARKYVARLREQYRSDVEAYKQLTALLEQAYGQELSHVTAKVLLEADATSQLVSALDKLAQLHQEQGQQTKNLKYYTDAAVLYQTILHACQKDTQDNWHTERHAAYDGLAQIKKAMLATCKAKVTALKVVDLEQQIENDKSLLEALRARSKQQVEELDKLINQEGMSEQEEKKAEQMYIEGSEKLFGEITEGMKKFVARLYKECEEELEEAPCNYTVIGMGSMALQHITPYSDLEMAIIMDEPKDKATAKHYRDYLRKLTHLVHFRVINLGETVVPQNRYGVSLDHICHAGVQFDLGGKTPLNRIDEDKPYDLIQPVDGMMWYLKNEDEKAEHVDKLLPYLLESTYHIRGDKELYESYVKERAMFLTTSKTAEGIPVYQARALHVLIEGIADWDYCQPKLSSGEFSIKSHKRGTLYQFKPQLVGGSSVAGQLYNVKQEIYR